MENTSPASGPLIENYLLYSNYAMVEVEIFYQKQGWSGFWKFWKVMEIDDAIFQDLESFGEESVFGFLFRKILKYPKINIRPCRIKHCACYFCSFYYL